jgi:DNA repair exonuclease SbcCD ATPase subunit
MAYSNHIRQRLEQAKGLLKSAQDNLNRSSDEIDHLEMDVAFCEEGLTIVRHVAQETQKQLEYRISELVSLAMYSVFDSPYEFELDFVQRRNRTEADIWFSRGGNLIKPVDASGGGAVDVAAFALRVALWNLAMPKTAPIIILDEPLKWLKGGSLPEKGAQMMQELSDRLHLQLIIISHIPDQIEGANRRIEVEMKNKESRVITV